MFTTGVPFALFTTVVCVSAGAGALAGGAVCARSACGPSASCSEASARMARAPKEFRLIILKSPGALQKLAAKRAKNMWSGARDAEWDADPDHDSCTLIEDHAKLVPAAHPDR